MHPRPHTATEISDDARLMPTFIIIGAAKAGTTALHHILTQHPDVCMSRRKEPNFFAFEGGLPEWVGPGDADTIGQSTVTSLSDYQERFAHWSGEKAIGEASPVYLYHRDAARNIRKYCPSCKLIVVLRDPAEIAFSMYSMLVRDGREKLPFRKAVSQCEYRVNAGWEFAWDYLGLGCLGTQLERYTQLFPADQLLILFHDDFKANSKQFMEAIVRHIGVEWHDIDCDVRKNVSMVQKQSIRTAIVWGQRVNAVTRGIVSPALRKSIRQTLEGCLYRRASLSQRDRRFLVDISRAQVQIVEQLTGRQLEHWLA